MISVMFMLRIPAHLMGTPPLVDSADCAGSDT